MNTTCHRPGAGFISPHAPFVRSIQNHRARLSPAPFVALVIGAASLLVTGCASSSKLPPGAQVAREAESQALRPGDVVKIAFPRTPTLDTVQQIRRDGKLNLYLIGEVQAANQTPTELEAELLKQYSSQLVSKEVRVTVVSSAFSVFVTGAVVRPGKLNPDRAVTVFDAIMEAGGFDTARADMKAVTVIRSDSGRTTNYKVNLQAVLDGKSNEPFYLQAYDVVYVPEKFSWF